jgi:hypothetical protein
MGDFGIDQVPPDGDTNRHGSASPAREEWVRANFVQIFGTSVEDLQAQGIDPRQYALEHRSQIRRYAQAQRRRGMAVPDLRSSGGNGPGSGGPGGSGPFSRGYGYGGGYGGRYGMGFRGGGAWIGIVVVLFALRFVLVDSLGGSHAATFWVIGIGVIFLAARVFLFSWLRRRRRDQRQ